MHMKYNVSGAHDKKSPVSRPKVKKVIAKGLMEKTEIPKGRTRLMLMEFQRAWRSNALFLEFSEGSWGEGVKIRKPQLHLETYMFTANPYSQTGCSFLHNFANFRRNIGILVGSLL